MMSASGRLGATIGVTGGDASSGMLVLIGGMGDEDGPLSAACCGSVSSVDGAGLGTRASPADCTAGEGVRASAACMMLLPGGSSCGGGSRGCNSDDVCIEGCSWVSLSIPMPGMPGAMTGVTVTAAWVGILDLAGGTELGDKDGLIFAAGCGSASPVDGAGVGMWASPTDCTAGEGVRASALCMIPMSGRRSCDGGSGGGNSADGCDEGCRGLCIIIPMSMLGARTGTTLTDARSGIRNLVGGIEVSNDNGLICDAGCGDAGPVDNELRAGTAGFAAGEGVRPSIIGRVSLPRGGPCEAGKRGWEFGCPAGCCKGCSGCRASPDHMLTPGLLGAMTGVRGTDLGFGITATSGGVAGRKGINSDGGSAEDIPMAVLAI